MQLTVDPGHDFLDVMEQLCGENFVAEQTFDTEKSWYDNNPLQKAPPEGYPTIDMSGFAANYARQFAEPWREPLASCLYNPEKNDKIREVMTGVEASANLTLRQLARHYALCDHWHSSMPGPTWPNRFFAVAGTSGGLDDSPSKYDVAQSMLVKGLTYNFDNGTLFDRLDERQMLLAHLHGQGQSIRAGRRTPSLPWQMGHRARYEGGFDRRGPRIPRFVARLE